MSTHANIMPTYANIMPKPEDVARIDCSCGSCYSKIPQDRYFGLDSVNKKRIDNLYKFHENHTVIKKEILKQYVCNCGFITTSFSTMEGHIQIQHKYENYKSGYFKKVPGHKIKCSLCDSIYFFSCEENIIDGFKRKHPLCSKKGARTIFVKMNCEVYQPIKGKVDDALLEEGCFDPVDLDGMIWHLASRVASW